jgi:hypothetical protein
MYVMGLSCTSAVLHLVHYEHVLSKKMTVFTLHQDPDVDMYFVVMSAMMRHTPVDHCFESRSESKRAKMTHKNRKKLRNFMFWSAGCSLLRAKASPVARLSFMEA